MTRNNHIEHKPIINDERRESMMEVNCSFSVSLLTMKGF
jgi:hypothetical protein